MEPQMLIALAFMIAAAMVCIYGGSYRLLRNVRLSKLDEKLGAAEAAAFPVTGSCVLFGLYVILKYIPKNIVNMVLSVYLSVAAIFALGASLRMITGPRIVSGVVSVAIGVAYFYSKNWILNNVMAVAICITAISSLPITNFKTSAILLLGLFVYDIFWVFGTDVMVSVATGIEGPIKLLFPQTLFGSHERKSLLGLGDIVIPGFFVSQTLVFSKEYVKRGTFYFNVAMWAYFLSLVNTMLVMVVFKHAQPALLYIVPWLLLSVLLAALVKGDLAKLFSYDVDLVTPKRSEKSKKRESEVIADKIKQLEEDHKAAVDKERAAGLVTASDMDGITDIVVYLVKELFGYGPHDSDETEAREEKVPKAAKRNDVGVDGKAVASGKQKKATPSEAATVAGKAKKQ